MQWLVKPYWPRMKWSMMGIFNLIVYLQKWNPGYFPKDSDVVTSHKTPPGHPTVCGFDWWDPRVAISHYFTGWSAQNDSQQKTMKRKGGVEPARSLPSSPSPFTLHFHIWSMAVSQPEFTAAQTELLLRVSDVKQTEQKSKMKGDISDIQSYRNRPTALEI